MSTPISSLEPTSISWKVPRGHLTHAVGEPLDGADHGFGQEEGEEHRDGQTEHQRLQNEGEQLVAELLGGLAVVIEIDDVTRAASLNGDRHIHIRGAGIAGIALLALEGGGEIGGDIQLAAGVIRGGEAGGGLPIQNIVVAGAAVYAQRTHIAAEDGLDLFGGIGLSLLRGGHVTDKLFIGENGGHVGVEFVQIKHGDGVHQERAYHRHQRHDEQHHDEHQLHMERAKHTPSPPVPLCNIICYFSSGWELK